MPPKIKTFKEFLAEADELSEQAVARYGDFPLDLVVTTTSEFIMDNKWQYCCNVETRADKFELYKIKSSGLIFIVGSWAKIEAERVFLRIAEIKLRKENQCGTEYHAVDLVRVSEEYRGSGVATALYEALVRHEKLKLISDTEQYFGARKLWAKLSKKPTLTVDILDTRTCVIVHKDIKIEHGPLDWNVDERVWSYENDDLIHLRMVLKTIK